MVAGKGGVIIEEDIAEIRTLMPSITVRKMGHVGHMIPWEDLDGFIDTLKGFVD